jgi:uncharacterized membrane protein
MSGTGFEMKDTSRDIPGTGNISRGILFVLPSIVITVVSVLLFSLLTSFTPQQQNTISITIIAAVILSMVGMAGMQVLVYRIVESRDGYADGAAARSITVGMIYSIIFSIIMAALASPYFFNVLHFSVADFMYFAALLFLFSSTWILVSVFWASGKYGATAVIFIISYLVIFGATYFAYRINHSYAITGYTIGTAVLFLVFLLTSAAIFRKPDSPHRVSGDYVGLGPLISQSSAAIMFNIFYILAIFLDKIIVWVSQGAATGQGLSLAGPYTQGAFLGLIPMLSIAVVAYFARRTQSLVDNRYTGTYTEIQKRIVKYKRIYSGSVTAILLITIGLAVIVAAFGYFFINDFQVLRVLLTIASGSIFFVLIIFNSGVLAIFGKTTTSTYSVLMVIIFELLTIPFVSYNAWYCSLGFLIGSFIGFLVSFMPISRLFSNYEYNIFSLLLKQKIN